MGNIFFGVAEDPEPMIEMVTGSLEPEEAEQEAN
jgi:hypothetical protein